MPPTGRFCVRSRPMCCFSTGKVIRAGYNTVRYALFFRTERRAVTRTPDEPKFSLGNVAVSTGAMEILDPAALFVALIRHQSGDWGDLDTHDVEQNEYALQSGGRLFSVYSTSSGQRFYVITEQHARQTSVLLPREY